MSNPAFLSFALSSGLNCIKALEIPKATASACADNPLPFRVTCKSNCLSISTTLKGLFDLTEEEISNIDGFASLSAKAIVEGLIKKKTTIDHMLSLGFNLLETPLLSVMEKTDSPVSGLSIVFSGKMTHGPRDDMKNNAEALGAKTQDAVSSKTDLLVCGESVGNKKLEKAKKLSVRILSEKDYLSLIKG